MAKTIVFEMPESEAKKFESLLDETLIALNRLEVESLLRDARLLQRRERTEKLMDEIERRLTEVSELHNSRKRFTTSLSWE